MVEALDDHAREFAQRRRAGQLRKAISP
jgi:hypothetical protein